MASGKHVHVKTTVSAALSDGASEIAALAEEMGSWRDGMEEKLSHTDKYQAVSDACDTLENADIESLVDTLVTSLEGADGSPAKLGCPAHVEGTPCAPCGWSGKARNPSKWNSTTPRIPKERKAEPAIDPLFAESVGEREIEVSSFQPYKGKSASRATRCSDAVGAMRQACDVVQEALDELHNDLPPGATDEETEVHEAHQERIDELRSELEEVTSALDELEGVEFPGMYG